MQQLNNTICSHVCNCMICIIWSCADISLLMDMDFSENLLHIKYILQENSFCFFSHKCVLFMYSNLVIIRLIQRYIFEYQYRKKNVGNYNMSIFRFIDISITRSTQTVFRIFYTRSVALKSSTISTSSKKPNMYSKMVIVIEVFFFPVVTWFNIPIKVQSYTNIFILYVI